METQLQEEWGDKTLITAIHWINSSMDSLDWYLEYVNGHKQELTDRIKAADGVEIAIAVYHEGGVPLSTLEACHSIIQQHIRDTEEAILEAEERMEYCRRKAVFAVLKLLNQN